jgi:DNA-binding response OmpR family regulator
MPTTILVVEDEKKLNRMICDYLEAVGFETQSAFDGPAGLQSIQRSEPDLIVLDVMLPGMDGMDVTRQVRQQRQTPIIILTARGDEGDKLLGLELGADDYITKPFSVKELAARVRAVLRRTSGEGKESQRSVVRHLDLEADTEKRLLTRDGTPVVLTSAQFDLLCLLMQHPGRVFTRAEILRDVFDTQFEGYERTIDVHIKNIRRAIESDPAEPRYLQTVWGVGYRMAEETE